MKIELELQVATGIKTLPHPCKFKEWISIIFSSSIINVKHLTNIDPIELTIRIVEEEEMADLNYRYRKKSGPTNVLSFSADHECYSLANKINYYALGDLVICANVVEQEAKLQNKELLSHWAHMVIHGILHLLGHDHKKRKEAKIMEDIEIILMQSLGFSSPY